MLNTVIVGGGLSGLALASLLGTKSVDYRLFEARERLGGRVLTLREPARLVKDARGLTRELPGLALDCGPTWFWPSDNPQMARLLGALGIATFGQHETGRLVFAPAAGVPPQRAPSQLAYASAQRIVGGVGAVIDALASRVGAERIRLGHELLAVAQLEDCVELSFACQGVVVKVRAGRVVLALPPRLVHERIEFSPTLPAELRAALARAPTWMASHAKALSPFPRPFWRENGDSGAAFAPYRGAVLGEVFDASDATNQPALGGFFALSPDQRRAQRDELGKLVHRQLAELFGPLPEGTPEPHIQDWATERFTTSTLDLEQPASEPTGAPPLVREPLWNERLFIGGTETGLHHPGHLEGALEAAMRIAALLLQDRPAQPGQAEAQRPQDPALCAWLEHFSRSLPARKAEAATVYRDSVQRALSSEESQGVTQRALLEAAASVYRGVLSELASAEFPRRKLEPSEIGEHANAVLASLAELNQELVRDAMKTNQTSCALRAFPEEARPDDEYLQIIRSDLQTLLQEFKRRVERLLGALPSSAA